MAQAADPAVGLGQIQAADPSFDLEVFRRQAFERFLEVKNAIASRDLAPVVDFLSDAVYDDLQGEVEHLLTRDQTADFDGLVPTQASVIAANHGPQGDAITLGIRAVPAQYMETSDRFTEYWTFSRVSTATARRDECPTCGAPISADTGRVCQYCKTLLPPRAQMGWIVAAIRPAQENLG